MRVIKKLGNNVALCVDGQSRELIALGVGIGFPKCPYELTDMSKVDRTFYDIDNSYLDLLNKVDSSIFEICADIIDLASTLLNVPLNPNAVFTLTDHISFAIIRLNKGMLFSFPLSNELRDLYPTEVKIAKYALNLLEKKKKIVLPESEIYGIAMNIINSEQKTSINFSYEKSELIIDDIVTIIEEKMNVMIERDTFNYSRFISHMTYLLKRRTENRIISSENKKLYETLKNEYSKTYHCVLDIKEYLIESLGWQVGNEELIYLILHVNRLCSREGCNE